MAAENVFKYDKTKITRDTHVKKTVEKILSGTSDEWKEWKEFIEEDEELHECLEQAVTRLVKYYEAETNEDVLPSKAKQILAALRYCKPVDVKVIILGHDPACGDKFEGKPLATGLAFSFPRGATEKKIQELEGQGCSVLHVHTALRKARIEPGASCCHEHWAKRGVLLLNACLTINPKNSWEKKTDDSGEIENPHFKYWKSFICNLLLRLLRKIDKESKDFAPVYVLCWGTHARDVGRHLKSELGSRGGWDDDHAGLLNPPPVIIIGHHPTFPQDSSESKFIRQATNQFKAIKRCDSTLFNQDEEEERRIREKIEEEERRKKEERGKKKEERRKKKEDHQDDVNQISDTVASGMHINK